MSTHEIRIEYNAGEKDGQTYITIVPVRLGNQPLNLSLRDAVIEAAAMFLASLGRDLARTEGK